MDEAITLLTRAPQDGREALAQQLRATTDELTRLVKVAARVGDSEEVVQGIRAAEIRAKELRSSLASLDEHPPALDRDALRQHLITRTSSMTDLLRANPTDGRGVLKTLLLGRLVLHAQESGAEIRGSGTLLPVITGGVPQKLASPREAVGAWKPLTGWLAA